MIDPFMIAMLVMVVLMLVSLAVSLLISQYHTVRYHYSYRKTAIGRECTIRRFRRLLFFRIWQGAPYPGPTEPDHYNCRCVTTLYKSAEYLELLAGAFLKETGLKPSEAELVQWFDPNDSSIHWQFRKRGKVRK